MPVYAYKCGDCGHEFDQYQKFTDDALTVCPVCNHLSLRKVFQPVGIVFKGKGFYATDNRSTKGLMSPGTREEHNSDSADAVSKAAGKPEAKISEADKRTVKRELSGSAPAEKKASPVANTAN